MLPRFSKYDFLIPEQILGLKKDPSELRESILLTKKLLNSLVLFAQKELEAKN